MKTQRKCMEHHSVLQSQLFLLILSVSDINHGRIRAYFCNARRCCALQAVCVGAYVHTCAHMHTRTHTASGQVAYILFCRCLNYLKSHFHTRKQITSKCACECVCRATATTSGRRWWQSRGRRARICIMPRLYQVCAKNVLLLLWSRHRKSWTTGEKHLCW